MLKCRFELVPGFEMCSIYIPTQPISDAIIESLEVARLGPTQIVRTRHIFLLMMLCFRRSCNFYYLIIITA